MASTSAGRKRAGAPEPRVLAHPDEIADPLNLYVYHPLAGRLARLLRPTGISPNAVSAISGLTVAAAAFCYVGLGAPLSVILGLALHLSWHVVDGADGALARLTGQTSAMGELIDGIADYVSHVFLYTLLAVFLLAPWIGPWAYLAALLAGLSRIAQSSHSESQRRTYVWRVYGTPWLKQAQASGDTLFEPRGLISRIFVACARLYIRLASATNPHSVEIDEAFARSAGDEAQVERLRNLYRSSSRGSLLYQRLLGANPRTILLGLSMALGSPLWFFLVEMTFLNLLLALSIAHQRRCNRVVVSRLGPAPDPSGGG